MKRFEGMLGPVSAMTDTVEAMQKAFEANGIKFIDEGPQHGDGGPGVRLQKASDQDGAKV